MTPKKRFFQKQPPEVFYKKALLNISQIHIALEQNTGTE